MRRLPSLVISSALGIAAPAAIWAQEQVVPQTPRQQPPVIAQLAINESAAFVSARLETLELGHLIAGSKPLEYRVSSRADMSNALWLQYSTPIKLRGWQSLTSRASCKVTTAPRSGRGKAATIQQGRRLNLYFQVRAALGSGVDIINGQRVMRPQFVESNIVSDSICVIEND